MALHAGLCAQQPRFQLIEPLCVLEQARARMRELQLRLAGSQDRLHSAMRAQLQRQGNRLDLASRALRAISPLATLERGFAIITRASDGALVRSSQQLRAGERIAARLATGELTAEVTGTRE